MILQTDYIDIIFFHLHPKCKSEIAGAIDVLGYFKQEGHIRKIAVAAHSIEELKWTASNPKQFDGVMTHLNPLIFEEKEKCLVQLKKLGLNSQSREYFEQNQFEIPCFIFSKNETSCYEVVSIFLSMNV